MHHYYAARSGAELEGVCEALGAAFGLPPFVFDCHDNWWYGWSESHGLRLNVTRASDDHTVETWMHGCAPGVNYQVILTAEAEPTGFASRLAGAPGSEVIRYATIDQRADAAQTDAPEDPPPAVR